MMKKIIWASCLLFLSVYFVAAQSSLKNYIYVGLDRDSIKLKSFYDADFFAGAQIKYTWKMLEPAKDEYDFSKITADLNFLTAHHKKLFVQVSDLSYSDKTINVPNYLRTETTYNGGANRQYKFSRSKDRGAEAAGWVARRWDPAVRARFTLLLTALARHFDGEIEGIILTETDVNFGDTGKYYPAGYTAQKYAEGIRAIMLSAHTVFKKSKVIQYADYMPGEWLPTDDKGYLKSIYEFAQRNQIGIGAPDLIPWGKSQMNHAYKFARFYPKLIKAYTVQDGNYTRYNPKTDENMTAKDLYNFAQDYLKANYIFWSLEEPYFLRGVLPFMRQLYGKK